MSTKGHAIGPCYELELCPIDDMEPVEVLNRVVMKADLWDRSRAVKERD